MQSINGSKIKPYKNLNLGSFQSQSYCIDTTTSQSLCVMIFIILIYSS